MRAQGVWTSLLLLAAPAWGAGYDPALYQDLHWRLIGPFRAGRVLTVSGVPGEPDHFYFGAVNGGVWESRNAGRTWRPIFDDQPVGSIGALAVAPSDPRVLYVGTGEADMRSDIAQGEGVFRSADGGATWSRIGLEDTEQIGKIVVDPRDADVVFVAALGHPYGANEERGVFRSRDGGRTWQKVLFRDADTGAIDLALEPGHPDVVYAALWRTRRTPWNIYPPSSGPGSGVYKSTDGGDHWVLLGGGLPENPGRVGIAVARSRPQRVYAIVDADRGGLYRSDDGGTTWTRTSDDERIWGRGWYFGAVTVDPANPDVVYVCNTGLYRSEDGGRTFVPYKSSPGGDDYHEIWIDPRDPSRQALAVDQGAVVTVDGGRTWSSWYNQPTAQLYRVSTDSRTPYWVYGPQQDSGAVGLPSRTVSRDGITMRQFDEVTAGGEAHNVAPDPLDPDVLYGGTVERLDLRTQQTQDVDPTMAYPDLQRATWTLPLAFSHRDPHVLYFARQRIYRTADGGRHWDVISPDLTREDPGAPANLDPVTAAHDQGTGPRRGVVYALAPSRLTDGELWAGTDDGKIWRTGDDGGHWQDVTPAGLGAWSKVAMLEVSHFDAGTVYAAVDRHRLEDRRPYVYRTHDGGTTWQLAVAGIPDGHFVNCVREDPVRRGLLYAATELGVYVSFDDGDHWQSLQLDLPPTSVRDLDVHGDDLVAGTHGRGIWILDGLTPLRQLDEEVAKASSWLFAPAPAARVRPEGFAGTPFPKDEPMAANPPFGAWIDYVLATTPAQPVTLEVLDAAGAVVRHYSSAVAARSPDLSKLRVTPDWFATPSTLSTAPGMHRFVWPLRYPAPPELVRKDPYGDGVWAPPGRYTLVLTVDGARHTQTLDLEPAPGVDLPGSAYAEQFELAKRIEAAGVRVVRASNEADDLGDALDARLASAPAAVRADLAALRARVAAVSGVRPEANSTNAWAFPPKSTATLRWVQSALETLARAVDGADAAPTPDARTGLEKTLPLAERALADWQQVHGPGLAALQKRLRKAKQPPLELGH